MKNLQKDKDDFKVKFFYRVFDFPYELQIKKILKEIFENKKPAKSRLAKAV
ncbi:hypothetical protein MWU76_06235 [Gelidibacter sp. F2691]|nr:hypothetical protein [Gelidibacter sp. F2691]